MVIPGNRSWTLKNPLLWFEPRRRCQSSQEASKASRKYYWSVSSAIRTPRQYVVSCTLSADQWKRERERLGWIQLPSQTSGRVRRKRGTSQSTRCIFGKITRPSDYKTHHPSLLSVNPACGRSATHLSSNPSAAGRYHGRQARHVFLLDGS